MKFNFVIPSWSYWEQPTIAQPLTQMYLATILENEGHEIRFIDFRDGKKTIPKADANFYTVASPDFEEVRQIIKENPGVHIAGGPHVNIFPDKSLEVFDAIAIGRGEEAIKQIAKDLQNNNLKRKYDLPVKEQYPFPKRHFLPKEKVVTSLFKTIDIPSTTVLFSHGCPMQCIFCANYNRQQTNRRKLEDISDEIDYLKREYKIKGLSLQDEICIPVNHRDAEKFLKLMWSKEIIWRGQTRAGVDEDIIKMASLCGCLELSVGLESIEQSVLDLNRKGIKVEQVEHTLSLCKKYGIKTRLYLLNGLPGEPKDIVKRTIEFLDRVNPDVVLLSTLQPYPGSEIYNHPERFGIAHIDKDFSKYNHLKCRFANSKDNLGDTVPFEYEKDRGISREQLTDNLITLQTYLRSRGMNK
jgi:anaerobic magnesium-protoporphyrin IX monomethyl ester cyclase